MKFYQEITLKNGKTAVLRNGTEADGSAVLENFNATHAETDYLLSYPDETTFDASQEGRFLSKKEVSPNEVELIAIVDGKIVGTAGIDPVGAKYKVRHRAEFGISVLQEYWGLGIGTALLEACISCAKQAGYTQIELTVASENTAAISLYKKAGFVEYGRNPKGFNSRITGYQELIYMLLEIS